MNLKSQNSNQGRGVFSRLTLWLATGFGLGYSPVASGTFGALPGLLIVLALAGQPWRTQIVVAVLLAAAAIPICSHAEEQFGRTDDGRIVADEYATFLIATLGLPWAQHHWLLGLAFVTSRVLDIIKPPPARQAQSLSSGLGIVMDDVFSSLYALGVNHAVWWAAQRWL